LQFVLLELAIAEEPHEHESQVTVKWSKSLSGRLASVVEEEEEAVC